MHKFGNYLVVILTIILFIVSVFVKGFTHELLIEAGVLLVSIKLIMMNYKISSTEQEILKQLNEIKEKLKIQ
jgi:hypothetical protein